MLGYILRYGDSCPETEMETDEIQKERIKRMKHYKCGNCRKTIEYEFLVQIREKAIREHQSARTRPPSAFAYWGFRCPHCNIEHVFHDYETRDTRKYRNPFSSRPLGRHLRRR